MVLENKSYVPTLAVRASEMNGLEFLPGMTKDRIAPCFLLAPWANSGSLDRTIDRIERAFPNRQYFLDIDRDYQFTNLESTAQFELSELLDPTSNFSNWLRFVETRENVMPCIQTRGQSTSEIRAQIEEVQNLGRIYCIRIFRERFPSNLDEIVEALSASGTADFVIILEGGWARDPLNLAAWFEGTISGSFNLIDAQVPIILSCTSMPKVFSSMSGITEIEFTNRELFNQISRRFSNHTRIIYGDWGSTRPREPGGFANRPFDRIDYPKSNSWYIARNKEEEWTYTDAAQEIVNDTNIWNGELGIWGEELITQTTINQELGINTPQKNVAARVNIHLHLQAFYGLSDIGGLDFDEDWED